MNRKLKFTAFRAATSRSVVAEVYVDVSDEPANLAYVIKLLSEELSAEEFAELAYIKWEDGYIPMIRDIDIFTTCNYDCNVTLYDFFKRQY